MKYKSIHIKALLSFSEGSTATTRRWSTPTASSRDGNLIVAICWRLFCRNSPPPHYFKPTIQLWKIIFLCFFNQLGISDKSLPKITQNNLSRNVSWVSKTKAATFRYPTQISTTFCFFIWTFISIVSIVWVETLRALTEKERWRKKNKTGKRICVGRKIVPCDKRLTSCTNSELIIWK